MSDPAHAIFLPAGALVGLAFVVWLRMLQVRVGEMRRLGIHPQAVANSPQAAQRFIDTRAADNFRNLFELPVLFYAALGIGHAIGATGGFVRFTLWASLAWQLL